MDFYVICRVQPNLKSGNFRTFERKVIINIKGHFRTLAKIQDKSGQKVILTSLWEKFDTVNLNTVIFVDM